MGKGREDTPLGGGERKNRTGYRSLPTTNSGVVGGTRQKSEDDYRPRDKRQKSEKDNCQLGNHARKSGKGSEDPQWSIGKIRGPQKQCRARWAEVVRYGKLALWDQG